MFIEQAKPKWRVLAIRRQCAAAPQALYLREFGYFFMSIMVLIPQKNLQKRLQYFLHHEQPGKFPPRFRFQNKK